MCAIASVRLTESSSCARERCCACRRRSNAVDGDVDDRSARCALAVSARYRVSAILGGETEILRMAKSASKIETQFEFLIHPCVTRTIL